MQILTLIHIHNVNTSNTFFLVFLDNLSVQARKRCIESAKTQDQSQSTTKSQYIKGNGYEAYVEMLMTEHNRCLARINATSYVTETFMLVSWRTQSEVNKYCVVCTVKVRDKTKPSTKNKEEITLAS